MLHAFFASAETAVVSLPKSRLKNLIDEGHPTARLLSRLTEDSTALLASSQFGLKLAGFVAAAITAITFATPLAAVLDRFGPIWPAVTGQMVATFLVTLVLVLLMLVFGQLIPKRLASRHPDTLALWVAYPLRGWQIIATPFLWVVVKVTALFTGGLGGDASRVGMPFVTEEEIKTIVDAGKEGGVLEEEEKKMIYSIFEFGDTLAREIMVPRVDIVAVNVEASMMEALDVILEAGHSRVPVYEGDIDHIIGLLYAKDLLRRLRDGEDDVPLREMLRDVYFFPETKAVDDLFQELQQRKVHMAIVVDEYGGTAGLVTVEDILEEIVGEIQDEYDAEEEIMEWISEDEIIFNARIDLDDLNRALDLDLPTDENDTLGGLIYSRLGHVPQVGDQVAFEAVTATVLSVDGRRIDKVKIARIPPPGDRGKKQGQANAAPNSIDVSNMQSVSSDAQ